MENEQLIIEMIQNLTTSMDSFKTEVKQDVNSDSIELSDFKKEVNDRFD